MSVNLWGQAAALPRRRTDALQSSPPADLCATHALLPTSCRRWGSTGCYDVASLTRLQCKLLSDFGGFARDNCAFCASLPLEPIVQKVLTDETLLAGAHGSCASPCVCLPLPAPARWHA